ncbi:MAG TPA: Hsp20/alpha crystallin family protein [Peptococcaceae bacterium]|nr:Hsp20/alpha crystallin family protein [Peptococcaceae bacterium]
MFSLVPFRKRGLSRQRDFWDMDSIFDSFFNDAMFPVYFAPSGQMKVDIKENEKEYILEAEIPGAKRDEINLEIDESRLTISVDRNEEINEEQDNYIRKERRTCSMSRSFAVENILPEKATAKFENGVLTIVLPKKDATVSKYRRIEIQ